MSEFRLDFQDTETAFRDKSDAELKEKYRLFRMMNSPMLNEIGTRGAEFALSIGLPVEWLIKRTIFEQFCGGETIEECQATIDRLGNSGIGAILDYSVEGKNTEADFEHGKEEVIKNLDRAKNDDDIPFAVFKTTGIAPLGTLEKVSSGAEMRESNKLKWENAKRRVREICEYAHKIDQPVFIDAEESWIQNAIDSMAMEMMAEFNNDRAIVYTTTQMYRHDRLQYIEDEHAKAVERGYKFAVKLVRGAYMEKERERAQEMGYASPIHPDKKSTDEAYDSAVAYCLEHIDNISFVNGTHNEESTQKMAQIMEQKGLPHDHDHCFFSQLYGMSDNLSYILADNGYNVSKYVPYGPVKDAVPYLIRRARENSSVTGQMSRELDLISREMERRGI